MQAVNVTGFTRYAYTRNEINRRQGLPYIPDLKHLMQEYQQVVNESLTRIQKDMERKVKALGEADSQVYCQEFFSPTFEAQYEVQWDVAQALQLARTLRSIQAPIHPLIKHMDPDTLRELIAENPTVTPQTDGPILLVPLSITDDPNQLLPIDGNHRLIRAYLAHEETVPAVVFTEMQSIDVMDHDVYRDIYAFVSSVIEIIKYLIGEKSTYRIFRYKKVQTDTHRLCACGSTLPYADCCAKRRMHIELRK